MLSANLGINHRFTSPHHPQSNSQVERLNRVIKEALKAMCAENPTNWPEYLPGIAFAYRTAVHDSTGFTPYQLLFGRQPVIPADVVYGEPGMVQAVAEDEKEHVLKVTERLQEAWKIAFANNEEARLRQKHYYDRLAKDRQFQVGDWVLARARPHSHKAKNLKKALMRPLSGPWVVVKKTSPHSYLLQPARGDGQAGQPKRVNVADIIPYHRRTLSEGDAFPLLVQAEPEQGVAVQPRGAPIPAEVHPDPARIVRPAEAAVAPPPHPVERVPAAQPAPAPVGEAKEEEVPPAWVAQAVKRGKKAPTHLPGPQHYPQCWRRIASSRFLGGGQQYLVEWLRPARAGQAPEAQVGSRNVTQTWVDGADCNHPMQVAMIVAYEQGKARGKDRGRAWFSVRRRFAERYVCGWSVLQGFSVGMRRKIYHGINLVLERNVKLTTAFLPGWVIRRDKQAHPVATGAAKDWQPLVG